MSKTEKHDIEFLSREWLKPLVYATFSKSKIAVARVLDPYRLLQLLTIVIMDPVEGERFSKYYFIDLATNKIQERKGTDFVDISMEDPYTQQNPLDFLFNVLTQQERVLVFLKLPIVKREPSFSPELINNIIYQLLLSQQMSQNRNFLLIIVPSQIEDYFTPKILENVIIFEETPTSREERAKLFKKWLEDVSSIIKNVDIEKWIDATAGLYPYQLRVVFQYSLVRNPENLTETLLQLRSEIFAQAYNVELEVPEYNLEYVGGYEYAKEYINDIILQLQYRDIINKAKMELPRGMLLFGPPGTGKTYFAKAVAGSLNYPIVTIDFSMFATKWYGETERRLKQLIKAIEAMSPVIVLLDEVEQLGARRGETHEVTTRVVSILNTWLADKNRKAFVIATANYPNMLDPAFIRVGRFDVRLPFLYPNANARLEILKIHMFKVRNFSSFKVDVDLQEIVKKTHLYNCAELEEIVKQAFRMALREYHQRRMKNPRIKNLKITTEHFLQAMQSVSFNVEERKKELQEYINIARRFGTDRELLKRIENEYVKPSLSLKPTTLSL